MSSIPSFITTITSGIYGSSYIDEPLVQQFRSHLGLSADEPIPNTPAIEEDYIAFLSQQTTIVQFISTLSTQILGSNVNIENTIAGFRSSLGLAPSDPIPDTADSKEAFANYLATGNMTLLLIIGLTKELYGSAAAATNLLDGFRISLGLLADQPIPDDRDTRAAFMSYAATQSTAFSFISQFDTLVGLNAPLQSILESFRSYLGLQPDEAIPDNYTTCEAYVNYRALSNGFISYAASAIKQQYGTSIIQNLSLISEFKASLGIVVCPTDDADTKHAFLYFLTSPTAQAAQGFYGISEDATTSLALFRAAQFPSLDTGTPLPTDDATFQAYLAFLLTPAASPSGTSGLDIAQFMEDAIVKITGSPLTNEIITQFRAYMSLKSSDAIPNSDASKASFMSFLATKLAAVGKSEATNAISPHEEEVRRVLFSAFSMVITMMNTLQQTARVESSALQTYAEWEKEYTNIIASTPIYGPTSQNMIIANNIDFGKTTLGQDSITIRQVAAWLLQQIQTSNTTSATFSVSNPTTISTGGNPGFPSFLLTKNTDGSYTFTLRVANPDAAGIFTGNYIDLLSESFTPSATLTGEEQIDNLINGLLSQMTTDWNTNNFVSPAFNLWVNNYQRDSNGTLSIFSSFLEQDIPSTALKAYWSGNADVTYPVVGGNVPYGGDSLWAWGWVYGLSSGGRAQCSTMPHHPSIREIAQICVNEIQAHTLSSYTWTTPGYYYSDRDAKQRYWMFKVTKTSDGQYYLTWGKKDRNGSHETWANLGSHGTGYFTVTNLPLLAATTGLWGPWNDPGAGAWPETIPYPSSYSKASLQAVRSQANSYVGEINAQLQQYIQTAQARKSNIDNAMKTMQNLLSQTMQATTNQANLLDAIMQSLKSILSSIFH